MYKSLRCLLFVFVCLFIFQNLNAQLSRKHYLPPITSDDSIENQYIYISTPKSNNVSFKIIPIGKPASEEITGVVSNSIPFITTSFKVGEQLYQFPSQTATEINDKGYIIEASDVVYVSVRMRSSNSFQAATIVSKGASALGTDFRMGGFVNSNPRGGYLNFISVMATEDDTNVTFDDFTTGIRIMNYSGSLPFTKVLNEGESFIVSVSGDDGNPNDLIGTLVSSDNPDKPIVVNSGSATGSFFEGSPNRDYGIDQIVDASRIGTEYIFVKGDGENEWENVLIIAHEDNTEINVNNNGVVATINKGEWYVIEGNSYNATGNMFVKTSKPAFAYQGVGFGDNAANQGLFFVPPLSCENRGNVDNIAFIERIGSSSFEGGVTIVTNVGAIVKINGQPVNSFTTSGPNAVTGNAGYETYKVTNLTGNISIESDQELYCASFNRNGAATSGSFYSGFLTTPEISFDTPINAIGNCIPDVTLSASNKIFDTYQWEVYDDTAMGFIPVPGVSTNSSYKPTDTGRYRLTTTISCNIVRTFISDEIPVSICPDDYDDDKIIDNIDVDIDNDGILNSIESAGDGILDISDINNPGVKIGTNATNFSIVDETIEISEAASSFTGEANGNFTSTLAPGTNTIVKYALEFNKDIHFQLTLNNAHIPDNDEYFTIRIGPNTKNVTLLDPNDELLVDTSFNLEFETGVTEISASEIRFKFKPTFTGTGTFQFLANSVKEIIFEHKTTGVTTSTFNGNIILKNSFLDSDGDGIENMFDLDSDNDGIPDFQESTAQDVTLANTDTNQDGLDDIFNTIIPNQDTDNDGIFNYLDVDADNDGIYDIVEARNSNLDADNNGIIDNADTTTVGINGLFDALETTPDSGILINSIPNSDTASIVVANQDLFFNFADLDSDGDDCFDVIEAGFTGNGSGLINATPFAVDVKGKVINNADGYTNPINDNYITSNPIVITKFEDTTFCEGDTNELEIETNATSYQWQVFDGTNWQTINNNDLTDEYEDATSKDLKIIDTPLSFNNNKYRVLLNRTGNICPKTSDAITLTVNPKPILLNSLVELKQCADNAARNTIVNLTEAEKNISIDTTVSFEYYTTEADAIEGDVSKQVTDKKNYPVNNGTANAWARVVSDKDCFDVAEIRITASFVTDITINTPFEECDDFVDENGDDSENDGITFFDFSSAEQDIKNSPSFADPSIIDVFFYETEQDRDAATNPIPDISRHRNDNNDSYKFEQTIYVKIKNKNNNDCEGIGRLFLKTNATPEFSVDGAAPDDPIIICPKNIPYTLNASTSETYDYIWTNQNGDNLGTNQSIAISDAGEYTVTAFSRNNKNCPSIPKTIVVQKSNFETLSESFITIIDDISGTNSNLSIRIDIPKNPLINEEFQYALEDEKGFIIRAFQNDNIFNNIEGGVYKILVENKNGCGSSELLVSVLQFPKFITPNEDGINDTFIVKGATKDFYSSATINIFNRFGKLVAQEQIDSQGWNGMYNGKLLPPSDYWFDIILTPTDMSKPIISRKGNFSLVRK